MKVRVLGGPPTEMAKALGAVPTLIPMPDVYQSLDKGVVDGAAAPWEAVQGFRLYEVAKNYTIAPFYVAYFSVCANKQKWQSLPKEVRDAIMSVSGLAGAKFWGKNFFDTAEEGVIERAKAGNYELNRYQVPAEQLARWTKLAGEPIWEEWIKKMEAKGHKDATRHLSTTRLLDSGCEGSRLKHGSWICAAHSNDIARRNGDNSVRISLHSIEKWLWRCELVLVYASVLAALAMMCLTSADALSRYLLNRPIIGRL